MTEKNDFTGNSELKFINNIVLQALLQAKDKKYEESVELLIAESKRLLQNGKQMSDVLLAIEEKLKDLAKDLKLDLKLDNSQNVPDTVNNLINEIAEKIKQNLTVNSLENNNIQESELIDINDLPEPNTARLNPEKKEWNEVFRPTEVITIPDIHGDIFALKNSLFNLKLIDRQTKWIGGNKVVQFTGDYIDRGKTSLEVLDFLKKITTEAEVSGGKINLMIGNHEAMMLKFLANTKLDSWLMNGGMQVIFEALNKFKIADAKTLDSMKLFLVNNDDDYFGLINAYKPEFEEVITKLKQEIFEPEGLYFALFDNMKVMSQIDDVLYLHGGISPEWAGIIDKKDYINEINIIWQTALEELRNGDLNKFNLFNDIGKKHGGKNDYGGPFWLDFEDESEMMSDSEVQNIAEILKRKGLNAIIVGHRRSYFPQMADNFNKFGIKLICADVGMSNVYGSRSGKGGVLIDKKGNIRAYSSYNEHEIYKAPETDLQNGDKNAIIEGNVINNVDMAEKEPKLNEGNNKNEKIEKPVNTGEISGGQKEINGRVKQVANTELFSKADIEALLKAVTDDSDSDQDEGANDNEDYDLRETPDEKLERVKRKQEEQDKKGQEEEESTFPDFEFDDSIGDGNDIKLPEDEVDNEKKEEQNKEKREKEQTITTETKAEEGKQEEEEKLKYEKLKTSIENEFNKTKEHLTSLASVFYRIITKNKTIDLSSFTDDERITEGALILTTNTLPPEILSKATEFKEKFALVKTQTREIDDKISFWINLWQTENKGIGIRGELRLMEETEIKELEILTNEIRELMEDANKENIAKIKDGVNKGGKPEEKDEKDLPINLFISQINQLEQNRKLLLMAMQDYIDQDKANPQHVNWQKTLQGLEKAYEDLALLFKAISAKNTVTQNIPTEERLDFVAKLENNFLKNAEWLISINKFWAKFKQAVSSEFNGNDNMKKQFADAMIFLDEKNKNIFDLSSSIKAIIESSGDKSDAKEINLKIEEFIFSLNDYNLANYLPEQMKADSSWEEARRFVEGEVDEDEEIKEYNKNNIELPEDIRHLSIIKKLLEEDEKNKVEEILEVLDGIPGREKTKHNIKRIYTKIRKNLNIIDQITSNNPNVQLDEDIKTKRENLFKIVEKGVPNLNTLNKLYGSFKSLDYDVDNFIKKLIQDDLWEYSFDDLVLNENINESMEKTKQLKIDISKSLSDIGICLKEIIKEEILSDNFTKDSVDNLIKLKEKEDLLEKIYNEINQIKNPTLAEKLQIEQLVDDHFNLKSDIDKFFNELQLKLAEIKKEKQETESKTKVNLTDREKAQKWFDDIMANNESVDLKQKLLETTINLDRINKNIFDLYESINTTNELIRKQAKEDQIEIIDKISNDLGKSKNKFIYQLASLNLGNYLPKEKKINSSWEQAKIVVSKYERGEITELDFKFKEELKNNPKQTVKKKKVEDEEGIEEIENIEETEKDSGDNENEENDKIDVANTLGRYKLYTPPKESISKQIKGFFSKNKSKVRPKQKQNTKKAPTKNKKTWWQKFFGRKK